MRCLCDRTANPGLLNHVVRSCNEHPGNNVYDEYLSELLYSVRKELYPKNKEGKNMCEAIFEIFGTSSQEIAEKAKAEARQENQIIIDNLTQINESLIDENSSLANENSFLRSLLAEKGIAIPVRQ